MNDRARLDALALAGDLPGVLLDAKRLAASAPGVHGRRRAGQGEAFYLDHVRVAGPVISIVAGAAIFYVLAFWLGRAAIEHRMASALLFWLGFVLLSTGLTILVDGVRGLADAAPVIMASHVVKLAAAFFGARATVGAHSIAS